MKDVKKYKAPTSQSIKYANSAVAKLVPLINENIRKLKQMENDTVSTDEIICQWADDLQITENEARIFYFQLVKVITNKVKHNKSVQLDGLAVLKRFIFEPTGTLKMALVGHYDNHSIG